MSAPRPLAVYVHIPFCVRVCGYCDFNTYAGMDALKDGYTAGVVGEIEAWTPSRTPTPRPWSTKSRPGCHTSPDAR